MREIQHAFGPVKNGTIRIIMKDEEGTQLVFEGKLTVKDKAIFKDRKKNNGR